ncbi:50S ribosomal protein L13 [Candidatus Pacearchaeota archaeon CG10_big_fil_rev_8_21_14_0_10_31_9]|nr:MAG: 50S ribosomal protein L13 [Candidatus Pacearchaeota archaeon CG1_02_32_21]PIN93491.1 MAG: 50S ribosomal protein L13 [Candidatus Pacearchaeota archaeon CG10_big_fil_rev_8_21_14_0_10_31_9]PIZ83312.1 MAG: 50S ribosomal protein L13 [Candidatus Pacearchaeota archaeon CG_4_10_14_0_2_um_filter_05_32_18]
MEVLIDGKNAVMGRLSSYAAKQAMLGKEIVIINSNDVIITGRKEDIFQKYSELVKKGGYSQKGPKITRTPERLLKRVIRGMLSHKQERGVEALGRIKCYNETPEQYKDSKKIVAGKEKHGKYITLKELCRLLK